MATANPAELQRWQRAEELCGAALRALTGRPELYFRATRAHRGDSALPLFAPQLRAEPGNEPADELRGIGDSVALRLRFSDPHLHQRLRPAKQGIERLLFELLEQLRVESLVPRQFPGLRDNVRRRFAHWSLKFYHDGLTETAFGLLFYTTAQMCWARVNGCQVVEETEDMIEPTRAGIAPLLGDALAGLKRERHSQAAYAQHALAIAQTVAALVEQEAQGVRMREGKQSQRLSRRLTELLSLSESEGAELPIAAGGDGRAIDAGSKAYRVFTRRYDRELNAVSQVRPEQLRQFREHLDRRIADCRVNVARLARQFAARFAVWQRDDWQFGEEQGVLDGRRLSQLVSAPAERRVFKRERLIARTATAVTLLIDCSGSMKQYAEQLALLIDVTTRALDKAGVACEILGFTTGAWNGGRALQDWMAAGRPAGPGRMNEVCHRIFKDSTTPWRRARRAIAGLLKADLYREGIDGEAVQWAAERLRRIDAQRRLLIVISDGCPMDSATTLANDAFYLDRHLRRVVSEVSQQGIEVCGLGVGLDLSPYYRRSLALDLTQPVDNAMLDQLLRLFPPNQRISVL